MEFEIISDEIKPDTGKRGPLFTWPDECFDGQQRFVTPLQVKEMGYASLLGAQGSFRKQAEARRMRPVVVMVKTGHRKYPNGGLAIRALPGKPETKRCPSAGHEGPNPVPLDAFAKDRSTADGLSHRCRACISKARRERATTLP